LSVKPCPTRQRTYSGSPAHRSRQLRTPSPPDCGNARPASGQRADVRLLGPVELIVGGTQAEVAGAKRRAVLALLSLEFGHSVSVERFFEMLWSDEPPTQAKAALQGHVAALRKVLAGTSFRLVTRAPGYLLTGDADQVDLLRFEALTARALATGDDAESAVLLQEALDQWTGTALADLPETELRRAFVERLDESRNQAVSAWAERQLRLVLQSQLLVGQL